MRMVVSHSQQRFLVAVVAVLNWKYHFTHYREKVLPTIMEPFPRNEPPLLLLQPDLFVFIGNWKSVRPFIIITTES